MFRFFRPKSCIYFCLSPSVIAYSALNFCVSLSCLSFHLLTFSSHSPVFVLALYLSQFTNHALSFSFSLSLLYPIVSYFSLAPCARLNWQFSVSFQAHVKSSSSYRIVTIVRSGRCACVHCVQGHVHTDFRMFFNSLVPV